MLTNQKVICYNQIVHVGRLKLEEYPSLVEGTGLENQEVAKVAQGFESLFLRHICLLILSRDGAAR